MGEFILHTNTNSMLDIVVIETLCSYVVGSKDAKFIYEKLYERVVALFEPLGVASFVAKTLLVRPFSREITHVALIQSVLYYKSTTSSMSLKPNSIELSTIRKCTAKKFYEYDTAIELHYNDFGQSILFVLESTTLRDDLLQQLKKLCNTQETIQQTYQQWNDKQITNYQFLLEVNDYVGRSRNDFAHYPVFPWLFSDYDSLEVSLNGSMFRSSFLVSSKSKTADTLNILKLLKKKYEKTNMTKESLLDINQHWIQSQTNGQFIAELVPDFFEKEESSGTLLNNVKLPVWATNAAEFLNTSIEALESPIISKCLGIWINSIFGPATAAINTSTECNLLNFLNQKSLLSNTTLSVSLPFEVMTDKIDKEDDSLVNVDSPLKQYSIQQQLEKEEKEAKSAVSEIETQDAALYTQYNSVVQENITLGEKLSRQTALIKSLQTEREKLKQDCAHLREIAASIDLELSQTKFLLNSLKDASLPETEGLTEEVLALKLEKDELLQQILELKEDNFRTADDSFKLAKSYEDKLAAMNKDLQEKDCQLDSSLLKIADLNREKDALMLEVEEKASMLLRIEDMAAESAKVLETLQYKIMDSSEIIVGLEASKKSIEESINMEREQYTAIKASMSNTIQELKDRIVAQDLEYDKTKKAYETVLGECNAMREKHQKLAIQLQQSLETATQVENAKSMLEQSNRVLEEEYIAQRDELEKEKQRVAELTNLLDQDHENLIALKNQILLEREAKNHLFAQNEQLKNSERNLVQQLEYYKKELAKESKKASKDRTTPRFIKQIISNSVAEVKEKKYISLLEEADKDVAEWKRKYYSAVDDSAKLKSEVKNLNVLILKNSHESEKRISELEKLTKSYDAERKRTFDKILDLEKTVEDLSLKPKAGNFFMIPKLKMTSASVYEGSPRSSNPNSFRRDNTFHDFGSIERINTEALKSTAQLIANDFSNIIASNCSPQPKQQTPLSPGFSSNTHVPKVLKDDEFTVTADST